MRISAKYIAKEVDYGKALAMQISARNALLDSVRSAQASKQNTLLILQHPHTITAGRRIKDANDILRNSNGKNVSESYLRSLGAELHYSQRGGQLTYHGPGQMVVYPILNLKDFKMGARVYIDRLEQIIIDTCARYNLEAHRTNDTGVWIDNQRKIAAIGVHIAHHVTMHGIALNCNTDLSWFDHIVPCGITDKSVTSLSKELNS